PSCRCKGLMPVASPRSRVGGHDPVSADTLSSSRPIRRPVRLSWNSCAPLGTNSMASFVEIAQLGKTYETPSGPAVIVRDFTLYVDEGEFVCLLGHSGCGKTTVLSILMGLVAPSTGGVVMAGREIDGPGTDRGVVFQSATLLPWMSVRDNVRLAREQVVSGADGGVESYLA